MTPTPHPPNAAQDLTPATGPPTGPEPAEVPVPPWQHLVARPRSWRTQLFIKGRNKTVRSVVGAMAANRMTVEETAEDLDIPAAAVREALAYYMQHKAVIDAEVEQENRWLTEQGLTREPPAVPG